MNYSDKTQNRRAIEALRAGVPNQDAVRAMGICQPGLEKSFRAQLQNSRGEKHPGKGGQGLLIAGGFGSGKSHLLEYFKNIALEENFVCSKIVISKETPLYQPAKVFQTAIRAAVVPERRGLALVEITSQLDFKSEAYLKLVRWVNSPASGLSSMFAATLYLYEFARGDDEIRERILQFWAGDPLNVSEIRRSLRDLGEAATYQLEKTSLKELAWQRYVFILQLILAAGYGGWVLLIDEAELIGRYSLKQRAQSYAEIARLTGRLEGVSLSGLNCVLTISDDFESAVLDYRNDDEKIPARFSQSSRPEDVLLGGQAERGMQIVRRSKQALEKPNSAKIRDMFDKLRAVYTAAYGWQPDDDFIETDLTARTRQHIKRWITEWDLKRLYPGYRPAIESILLIPDYTESPEIEKPDTGLMEFNQDNQ